jgi:hypothetical protein
MLIVATIKLANRLQLNMSITRHGTNIFNYLELVWDSFSTFLVRLMLV